MTAYYSENDPLKAEVLREAIKTNAIAPGDVDERSICDVRGSDLRGYTQCHFFAGGGFWSLAGRLAGIPDDWPWWSGSCPCPSFSAAGKGGGFDDPRHLWPAWFRLIRECRPAVVAGEQADDAVGYGWLDLVQTDLEGEAYAVGKAILGAHSVGAPHIRQRLYFVAQSSGKRCAPRSASVTECEGGDAFAEHGSGAGELEEPRHAQMRRGAGSGEAAGGRASGAPAGPSDISELEHAEGDGRLERGAESGGRSPIGGCGAGSVDNADSRECQARRPLTIGSGPHRERKGGAALSGSTSGFWRDAEWIPCRVPKIPGAVEWRPIERGTFVLAARYPERVAELRLAGDAICVPTAAAFLKAYLATRIT